MRTLFIAAISVAATCVVIFIAGAVIASAVRLGYVRGEWSDVAVAWMFGAFMVFIVSGCTAGAAYVEGGSPND